MNIPERPKIYHIVHVDRLSSILSDGVLWCDAEVMRRSSPGATIGMNHIKKRRLEELTLSAHPDLHVGDCVPFYFCPRSVMLYLIYKGNHSELTYQGGQTPIVHLEADLYNSIGDATRNQRRWAFTTSNAGARYFESYSDSNKLDKIDWQAVQAVDWQKCKENKQAEFLMEESFSWFLFERVGVATDTVRRQVVALLKTHNLSTPVETIRDWYY
jgi:hypothetical protein